MAALWLFALLIAGILHRQSRVEAWRKSRAAISHRRPASAIFISSFFESMGDKFNGPAKGNKPKTESDLLVEYVNYQPWRAQKQKLLTIQYMRWMDSWREKYRNASDDSIYLYSVPLQPFGRDTYRADEIWSLPWLWTKTKAERFAWIQKQFENDMEGLSVQEFIELDCFYSEFDMPLRWGFTRLLELIWLNTIFMNIAFFVQLHGVQPTDIGLRPDGTLQTCSVQFHNCLSSSNDPRDTEHYAPPFHWDRSKSPEQAIDEIKQAYLNYPKRGLRFSYGAIDCGGWRPQSFNGHYFYAQADSLLYGYTDDIELLLDPKKREVQYRSSARLGQADFDVQRLRYNQFVRMLTKKGGWEIEPLPMLHYVRNTPYRWTALLLEKTEKGLEQVTREVSSQAWVGPLKQTASDVSSFTDRNVLQPWQATVRQVKEQLESLEEFQTLEGVIQEGQQELQSLKKELVKQIEERWQARSTPQSRERLLDSDAMIYGSPPPLLPFDLPRIDAQQSWQQLQELFSKSSASFTQSTTEVESGRKTSVDKVRVQKLDGKQVRELFSPSSPSSSSSEDTISSVLSPATMSMQTTTAERSRPWLRTTNPTPATRSLSSEVNDDSRSNLLASAQQFKKSLGVRIISN